MQQHPLIKEYLDIVFRRRWWIVIPAIVGLILSVILFLRFPKWYKAETRVQFRSQTISRSLLNPIVEFNPGDVVPQITGEITSEKYVQQVETSLQLIGTPGGPRDLTELTKMLQGAIELSGINPRSRQFDLTITWKDPRIAADIANELAAMYIRRNQEIRQSMTSSALDQLRETRVNVQKELEDVRAEVEKFRAAHKFELSSQQPSNLSAIANNRLEIDKVDAQIRDAEARIANNELQLKYATVPAATPSSTHDPRLDELGRLRTERARLVQMYEPAHPLRKRIEQQITDLEAQLGIKADPAGDTPLPVAGELDREKLKAQNEQLKNEIAIARTKRARLEAEIGTLQSRLDRTPDWQIELDKLENKEKALNQQYEDARSKEAKANEGAQVEQSNQAERFEVLNKARPPQEPFFPDLKLFVAMGLAIGAGLGIAMVLLLEVFDQSFKSEEQLAASIDVAILAVIPDLNRLPGDAGKKGAARRSRRAAKPVA